ncbi:hypothetical protein H6F90_12165 [Trichocoleus sp. FACHB-591]|uniref:hypothetical protein n=1 Tax=Trichocoleus sp. FACHB-591 TaxID=2692872 RepID=UPI00168A37BC|nr:hypothetical protein [Trichocoleus sp. FACHB-591]MBD2095902.1 hypothetical protein [Trichocoleus sp. FACHB-591]
MQLKLTRVGGWVNPFCCPICDQRYPLQPFSIIATLYSDSGVGWGEVCPRCYSLSAEQIRHKLIHKAQLETRIAQQTAALAQEPVHKPSLEQEFQLYREHSHD